MSKYVYQFEPDNETANKAAIMPASTLNVYASRAVPGAISVTMSEDRHVNAGTRLTREQAAALATALIELINEADDDPFVLGQDIGYANGQHDGLEEGYDNGFKEGYDEGFQEGESSGWEDGYELGNERGYAAAEEDCA